MIYYVNSPNKNTDDNDVERVLNVQHLFLSQCWRAIHMALTNHTKQDILLKPFPRKKNIGVNFSVKENIGVNFFMKENNW